MNSKKYLIMKNMYTLLLLFISTALQGMEVPASEVTWANVDWRTAYRVTQEEEEKKRAFFEYVHKKTTWKIIKENIDKPLDEVLEYFNTEKSFRHKCIILIFAARHGYIPAIKILLEYGMDIDTKLHPKEYTPLGYAIKKQHLEVIKFLLDNGADPKRSCANHTWDAFHAAAKWGKTEAILLLLKNNSHAVNYRHLWTSPLTAAILEGHGDIVKILLRHGAKVHAYDISTAKVNKRDDILPLLIQQFQYQQASTCTLL